MRGFIAVAVAATGFWACGPSSVSLPDPVDLTGPRTWYGSIAPLVGARCAICHTSGDIGPFPLETWDDVQPRLAQIKAAVASDRMPPFPPTQTDASGCPKIDDVRQMGAAEKKLLLDWLEDGAPMGEQRELPKPKPNKPLGDPTDRWKMPVKYKSTITQGDDYRCFLIIPNLLTPITVAAVSAEPGNRGIVHHSAVYLVPPDQLEKLRAKEKEDDAPGYSCFGGVGIEQAYPTGFWVPGNDAPLVPPQASVGYYLPVGWAFVLQQHYNLQGSVGEDETSVVLWRAPGIVTEYPHYLLVGNFDLTLPPMSKTTVESMGDLLKKGEGTPALNVGAEGRIYAVWGHMHLLGKSLDMDLVRPDGSTQCLLRIPQWQFHWQSVYKLKDPVVAKGGDKVRVRCSYENLGTTTVTYGEGTADEMCFGSVGMRDL